MKFKDVFGYIGDVGSYQIILVILCSVTSLFGGMQSMAPNFFAAQTDHWCQVTRLQNFSFDVQKHVAIPYDAGDSYDSCTMYDLDYDNLTDEEILTWDRSRVNSTATKECTDWVFDQSMFRSTVIMKYKLVCGNSRLAELTSTIYMAGYLIGSVISGLVSDRFGRKVPVLIGCCGYLVFALLQAFAPVYAAFAVFRFCTSFCDIFMILGCYVIRIEIVGTSRMELMAFLGGVSWSMGIMLVSGIAYAIRDVEYLLISISVPMICMIPCIWLMLESPRWLVTQRRQEEATKNLQIIAEVNKRSFPRDTKWEDEEQTVKGRCSDICQSRSLRGSLVVVYVEWFIVSLVYYGASFNAAAFGDVFLNTFLSGVIELPARLLFYLSVTHGGRRWPNGAGFLVTGAFMLACVPVLLTRPDMQGLLTALSTIGKGGITFAFACAYLYTSELFPTPVRHITMGTSSMIGRVGSMASPFLGRALGDIWEPMPSLLFGALSTLAGLLVFILPETRGKPIPDSITAAEILHSKRKQATKTVADNKDELGNDNKGFAQEDAAFHDAITTKF